MSCSAAVQVVLAVLGLCARVRRLIYIVSIALALWGCIGCGRTNATPSRPTPVPTATPAPISPGSQTADVLTYHNDNARSGLMANETILTPANVNPTSFGLLRTLSVDGKVDAQPLTRNELEHFSSLSHRELSRLYWGPNGDGMTEFAVRYRKSCKEFGFVVPPKFSDEAQASGEIGLTPEQYRAMPSAELKRRLREPRFKLQVWQLIKAGQI